MFHLDTLATLVAATLTLLLGRKLVHSVSFLKKYTIPEPVAGGLLVALALLVLKKSMGWEVNFDMSLRDPLMLAFFATIGLNANIASLRAGGRVVGIFLIVVVGLLVMQNAIGIGMASLLGLDPLMGLLAGFLLRFPAVTVRALRGVNCSLNVMASPMRRKWRWPVQRSVWCWAA